MIQPTPPSLPPTHDSATVRQAIRDNVWLHFTQMRPYVEGAKHPLVLVRGDGSTVWDDQGREYLDCLAGIYSVNAGYGRKQIVEAMAAQAEAIPYVNPFGYVSAPTALLGQRLAQLAPLGGDARVFFTSGGSESVETALKLAKQFHHQAGIPNRYKTISRRGAWHGTTMGALSVNGLTGARSTFGPLVPGARHVPMSHRYRCPYCANANACNLACADEIERLVAFEGPETIAALIVEPVQNSGGCIPPGSTDYFKRIRQLCDQTGILFIMDEVICGFGRLGTLFGSEYYGVQPDIITMAKGITSSYAPLGAVLVRKQVADSFLTGEGFMHGLTFGGHPVATAAALANLDIILDEDLPGRARETGAYLRTELEAAFHNHPVVGDIRGVGLFLGVEIVKDRATKETPREEWLLEWLSSRLNDLGLIIRTDGRGDPTTQITPPLILTRPEADRIVSTLASTFTELGQKFGTIGSQHAI